MFEDIDHEKNNKMMKVLNEALRLLEEKGIKDVFAIGSVGVSGHLGKAFKTFGDVELIGKEQDLKEIVRILGENGYEVLEDFPDRTAFKRDGVWFGFIDRSDTRFKKMNMEPKGAYENAKEARLYGVNFKVLNLKYLKALYAYAAKKDGKKQNQYVHTLELLNNL